MDKVIYKYREPPIPNIYTTKCSTTPELSFKDFKSYVRNDIIKNCWFRITDVKTIYEIPECISVTRLAPKTLIIDTITNDTESNAMKIKIGLAQNRICCAIQNYGAVLCEILETEHFKNWVKDKKNSGRESEFYYELPDLSIHQYGETDEEYSDENINKLINNTKIPVIIVGVKKRGDKYFWEIINPYKTMPITYYIERSTVKKQIGIEPYIWDRNSKYGEYYRYMIATPIVIDVKFEHTQFTYPPGINYTEAEKNQHSKEFIEYIMQRFFNPKKDITDEMIIIKLIKI
jgi:hypothetical protein